MTRCSGQCRTYPTVPAKGLASFLGSRAHLQGHQCGQTWVRNPSKYGEWSHLPSTMWTLAGWGPVALKDLPCQLSDSVSGAWVPNYEATISCGLVRSDKILEITVLAYFAYVLLSKENRIYIYLTYMKIHNYENNLCPYITPNHLLFHQE